MDELTPRRSRLAWLPWKHAAWAGIAWIVIFWRLGLPSLLDPDEAHYAELTREMLRARSWLVPLLDGHPYIDKPVLFHWLQGLAMTVIGPTEFAARLPSAVAAIALFGITRWAGKSLIDDEAGEWGAVMFATIPATFALSSLGLFDMLFATFLFGSLACLLVAARRGSASLEAAGYLCLAFAVMTKGPVALLLVGGFFSAAWLLGGEMRAYVSGLKWMKGLVLAGVVASPWFLWMYGRFDGEFVDRYLLAGNLFYFTKPASFSARAVSHVYYARVFAGGFFPWSLVLAGRGVDLVLRRGRAPKLATEEKLLWLWVALIVGFFTAARFKLDSYIFPAAPACCLIAARAWSVAARDRSRGTAGTRASVLLLAGVLIVAGSFATTYIFELNLELPAVAVLLPIVLTIGGAALMTAAAAIGWQVPRTPIIVVLAMLGAYVMLVDVGLPTLDRTKPTALAARTLRGFIAPETPVAIYRLEQWRASLRYYADRPLTKLLTPADVAAFLTPARPSYLLMLREDYRELRAGGIQLREVFKCRAVVRTVRARSGFRRQQWDDLIIVTDAPPARRMRLKP